MDNKISKQNLIEQAKNMIFTDLWIQDVDDARRYCFWYGGDIASWKFHHKDSDYEVYVSCSGDIYADLYDTATDEIVAHVKDKNNCGVFYDEMSPYLTCDDDIEKALDQPYNPTESDPYTFKYKLEMDYNNWVEWNVYNKTKKEWLPCDWADNICDPDDIYEAIAEVLSNDLIDWVEDIENNAE
jgi:hypothetical protein